MHEVTLPRSDKSPQSRGGTRSRFWGLLLILGVILLGAVMRVIPSATESGGLAQWLPWMNQPTVTLYFSAAEGRVFVPISRNVSSADDLPRTTLEELLRGPQTGSGLVSTLPPGVTIHKLEIRDDVAYVELAGATLTDWRAEQVTRATTAIHKSLTALPQIETVVLSIDGHRQDPGAGLTGLPLYFGMGSYLVSVDSGRAADATDPRSLVEAYLHGPPDSEELIGLPPDTALLGLDFNPENGLVKVNLSYTEAVRSLALDNPDGMVLVLTGLIATLTELPGVKAVMLDFEGHSQLGLGQCASLLRTPQLRPQSLNVEPLLP